MIDIESFKDRQRDVESSKDKRVELTDCLKMFEGVEDIFEKEGVKCDKCHVPTHHTKKMGVSRAPPILIIHLKRFKIINGYDPSLYNSPSIDQRRRLTSMYTIHYMT